MDSEDKAGQLEAMLATAKQIALIHGILLPAGTHIEIHLTMWEVNKEQDHELLYEWDITKQVL